MNNSDSHNKEKHGYKRLYSYLSAFPHATAVPHVATAGAPVLELVFCDASNTCELLLTALQKYLKVTSLFSRVLIFAISANESKIAKISTRR